MANRRPRRLNTTPHPTAADVEAQICASMSRQHRLLALSASDDVAGTWKHISVASTSAPVLYDTPLRRYARPIASEGQEVPKHAGGQQPPPASWAPATPSNSAPRGTNQDHPNATTTQGFRRKAAKTPPASPERASALPGDVGEDWAQLCAQFRRRLPPGSPMGLPGES
jgi:hypothetical protein